MENTPTSPVQPQPMEPAQQYTPQPIPKAGFSGPVIAAIIVGVLVLAGAVFAYTKLVNKPAETPTPTPSVSVSATPDLTAGWKTYTDTQYGFSLRYPANWTYDMNDVDGGVYFDAIDPKTGKRQFSEGTGSVFVIYIVQNSLSNAYNNVRTCSKTSPVPVTFNGRTGWQINCDSEYGGPYTETLLPLATSTIIDLRSGYMNPLHSKIISTLKFTDPTGSPQADPTAGWTNFSSKYFTLSFKYPPGGYTVHDSLNEITVVQGTYIQYDGESPGNNGFLSISRYTNGVTKGQMMDVYRRSISDLRQSTILVDGLSFTRFDGVISTGGGDAKIFVVFFDKSLFHARESGIGQSPDYLSIANQILSTFKFTK